MSGVEEGGEGVGWEIDRDDNFKSLIFLNAVFSY